MKPFVADVHTHSIVSGHSYGTVRELAREAANKKLQLLGVTEHAPGIPGTCDPIYFRNFADAPRNLYGVEMLYGSEINLLEGGKLSLDPRDIQLLDYAVVGIHRLCYEDAGITGNTDNLIRTLNEPKVRFIAHPDYNKFPLDYPALVQAAKEYGIALEVNNTTLRKPQMRPGGYDNYRIMLPLCAEYGVNIIVNTDAHDPDAVGDFTLARNLLEELHFPDELIINNDLDKLKAFLLQK